MVSDKKFDKYWKGNVLMLINGKKGVAIKNDWYADSVLIKIDQRTFCVKDDCVIAIQGCETSRWW